MAPVTAPGGLTDEETILLGAFRAMHPACDIRLLPYALNGNTPVTPGVINIEPGEFGSWHATVCDGGDRRFLAGRHFSELIGRLTSFLDTQDTS